MMVEIRIYPNNPVLEDFRSITKQVAAFWPIPAIGSYMTYMATEPAELIVKVLTVTYQYYSDLSIEKVVITTET